MTEQRNTLESQLKTVQAQLAQAQAKATDFEQQLAVSAQKLQGQTERANALQEELTQAKNAASQAAKDHSQGYQELQQTLQRDLAVALRMQALARSDQQDLQQRFAALQAEKDQQEALLVKVTQKLGSAAKHLHQLAQQENILETLPSVAIEETQVEKPAKKKQTKARKKGKKKSSAK